MTAKEHYEKHLGNFYSWMVGDFKIKQKEFADFLSQHDIRPAKTGIAIDLGAGHGIQSRALAHLGYKVISIDFNKQLLSELKENTQGLEVEIFNQDMQTVSQFISRQPELILCWGDTLTHLENKNEVKTLLAEISKTLPTQGKFLLSFRDYSTALQGDSRFIPVKSDENRILTCFLEYQTEFVNVSDLLYEKTESGWTQKISSYNKVRISLTEIKEALEAVGFQIELGEVINRMVTIIATKI